VCHFQSLKVRHFQSLLTPKPKPAYPSKKKIAELEHPRQLTRLLSMLSMRKHV